MGGVFKKIAKIAGAVLFFAVPGLAPLGAALLVGSTALDVVQQRKQQKAFQNALESRATAQTITVKSPLISRRKIYGRPRVGGMVFHISTSSNNKYLYMVIGFCDGPIKKIGRIYFDDEVVEFDDDAPTIRLTSVGKYAGKVRIRKHLGTSDQLADADLVSDLTEWTSNHRLRGIAYIGMRLTFSTKVFPNGLPNISAEIYGANDVLDGRDDSTKYTTNPALCLVHYLAQPKLGPGVDVATEIDQSAWDAAANACEETVALDAAGNFSTSFSANAYNINSTTHGLHASQIVEFETTGTLPAPLSEGVDYFVTTTTEDTFQISATLDGDPIEITNDGTGVHSFTSKEFRYTFNGVVSLEDDPESIIRLFRDAMAGNCPNIGGLWYPNAGVFNSPTLVIDEDMLTGPIQFRPKRGKRERFNTVKGFFLTERNRWQPVDYPPVTAASYVSADGQELVQPLDLPNTNTPSMANRIAKILLEKVRLERTLELECNAEAIRARAGGTVEVDLPRLGINSESYDVDGFNLAIENGALIVQLQLSQTSPGVYDWESATDEQSFQITAEPDLSDGLPSAPTGLALTNNTDARDLVSVSLTWDATDDEFVLQGGLAIVEWKKSADSDWQSVTASPTTVEFVAKGLEPDTDYDFRVAWRNKWGGDSDYVEVSNHQTQSSVASAYSYKHTQSTPATTWTIVHNLGYRPSVGAIFDGSGEPVSGDESTGTAGDPTGKTEIEIVFNSAITGTAYLS